MSYQPSIERLIGRTGIVVETVPGDRREAGVVRVDGALWSAETDWPLPLVPGEAVLVVSRDGLRLAVLPERR